MNTKTEKYKLYSQIMGNQSRTVETHIKEGRLYTKLLEYFTGDELRELVDTGEIKKLTLFSKVSIEKLEILKNLSQEEIVRLVKNPNESLNRELLLKNAMYKVEKGMDKSFVFPLFKDAIKEIGTDKVGQDDIRGAINKRIKRAKLSMLGHENHKTIILNFIERYLTNEELVFLSQEYSQKS